MLESTAPALAVYATAAHGTEYTAPALAGYVAPALVFENIVPLCRLRGTGTCAHCTTLAPAAHAATAPAVEYVASTAGVVTAPLTESLFWVHRRLKTSMPRQPLRTCRTCMHGPVHHASSCCERRTDKGDLVLHCVRACGEVYGAFAPCRQPVTFRFLSCLRVCGRRRVDVTRVRHERPNPSEHEIFCVRWMCHAFGAR